MPLLIIIYRGGRICDGVGGVVPVAVGGRADAFPGAGCVGAKGKSLWFWLQI